MLGQTIRAARIKKGLTQARLAHYELIGKHALGLKVDQARF